MAMLSVCKLLVDFERSSCQNAFPTDSKEGSMIKKLLIVHAVVLLSLSLASAQNEQMTPKAGPDRRPEAKALVERAAAFVVEHGREKGLTEMNKPDGQFVVGDLYVFAFTLDGAMAAQPKNPKAVGENLIDKPDSKGKLFRKEIIEKAKTEGSGWVDYFYLNPQTGKEEDKTTYLKRVGDLVICCGVYR
jgi:cytochrome c